MQVMEQVLEHVFVQVFVDVWEQVFEHVFELEQVMLLEHVLEHVFEQVVVLEHVLLIEQVFEQVLVQLELWLVEQVLLAEHEELHWLWPSSQLFVVRQSACGSLFIGEFVRNAGFDKSVLGTVRSSRVSRSSVRRKMICGLRDILTWSRPNNLRNHAVRANECMRFLLA